MLLFLGAWDSQHQADMEGQRQVHVRGLLLGVEVGAAREDPPAILVGLDAICRGACSAQPPNRSFARGYFEIGRLSFDVFSNVLDLFFAGFQHPRSQSEASRLKHPCIYARQYRLARLGREMGSFSLPRSHEVSPDPFERGHPAPPAKESGRRPGSVPPRIAAPTVPLLRPRCAASRSTGLPAWPGARLQAASVRLVPWRRDRLWCILFVHGACYLP